MFPNTINYVQVAIIPDFREHLLIALNPEHPERVSSFEIIKKNNSSILFAIQMLYECIVDKQPSVLPDVNSQFKIATFLLHNLLKNKYYGNFDERDVVCRNFLYLVRFMENDFESFSMLIDIFKSNFLLVDDQEIKVAALEYMVQSIDYVMRAPDLGMLCYPLAIANLINFSNIETQSIVPTPGINIGREKMLMYIYNLLLAPPYEEKLILFNQIWTFLFQNAVSWNLFQTKAHMGDNAEITKPFLIYSLEILLTQARMAKVQQRLMVANEINLCDLIIKFHQNLFYYNEYDNTVIIEVVQKYLEIAPVLVWTSNNDYNIASDQSTFIFSYIKKCFKDKSTMDSDNFINLLLDYIVHCSVLTKDDLADYEAENYESFFFSAYNTYNVNYQSPRPKVANIFRDFISQLDISKIDVVYVFLQKLFDNNECDERFVFLAAEAISSFLFSFNFKTDSKYFNVCNLVFCKYISGLLNDDISLMTKLYLISRAVPIMNHEQAEQANVKMLEFINLSCENNRDCLLFTLGSMILKALVEQDKFNPMFYDLLIANLMKNMNKCFTNDALSAITLLSTKLRIEPSFYNSIKLNLEEAIGRIKEIIQEKIGKEGELQDPDDSYAGCEIVFYERNENDVDDDDTYESRDDEKVSLSLGKLCDCFSSLINSITFVPGFDFEIQRMLKLIKLCSIHPDGWECSEECAQLMTALLRNVPVELVPDLIIAWFTISFEIEIPATFSEISMPLIKLACLRHESIANVDIRNIILKGLIDILEKDKTKNNEIEIYPIDEYRFFHLASYIFQCGGGLDMNLVNHIYHIFKTIIPEPDKKLAHIFMEIYILLSMLFAGVSIKPKIIDECIVATIKQGLINDKMRYLIIAVIDHYFQPEQKERLQSIRQRFLLNTMRKNNVFEAEINALSDEYLIDDPPIALFYKIENFVSDD